ncbi:ATP-binding protein [Clostridium sp. P21]|uniref:ATP-binding protein n=1 Tax=Clostridium muellerianum TaxID=2716538 RepID=A0A7Y0EGK3_9CLOT|nr:ATP-binding protein [Clostridium muellerianum]NMM62065.1 ATP-binding protein [Clostridium muellerianum]
MESISQSVKRIKEMALKCKERAPKANYSCPICRDTGSIITDQADGQPIIKICKCQQKEILRQQWIDAGFNIMSADRNFKTFKIDNKVSEKMKDMAMDYVENFVAIQFNNNNSISFLGQPGSGKTHICMAIALELIKKGFYPVYFPYREVITELKQNVMNPIIYQEKMNKYKKSKILIIDDLFKGGATESDIRTTFDILNYRYLNRLPIVVSSEHLSQSLLNIDYALGGRIIEMCENRILDIFGEEFDKRLE